MNKFECFEAKLIKEIKSDDAFEEFERNSYYYIGKSREDIIRGAVKFVNENIGMLFTLEDSLRGLALWSLSEGYRG